MRIYQEKSRNSPIMTAVKLCNSHKMVEALGSSGAAAQMPRQKTRQELWESKSFRSLSHLEICHKSERKKV